MAGEQKTINWNSIVTNAVSMLVAAVFVGAAVIVWNAATTIEDKINAATANIKENQGDLQAQYKTMTGEITSLHTEVRKLRSQLDSHDEVLRDKATVNSFSKDEPVVLAKYKLSDSQLSKLKKKDAERILNEYRKNISAIRQVGPLRR